jgi:hypothetical protein
MIRIVFTASNSLLGRIIRKLTKGRVSHVFFQHPSETWGGEWATQATWPMVMQGPAECARHGVVKEFECQFDVVNCFKANRAEVGKWYAFEGLVIFGWFLLIWRVFRHKIRHPFHSAKGDFCSELAVKIFRSSKSLLDLDKLDPDYTDPEMLLKYCEQHPDHLRELKA